MKNPHVRELQEGDDHQTLARSCDHEGKRLQANRISLKVPVSCFLVKTGATTSLLKGWRGDWNKKLTSHAKAQTS